MNMESHRLDQKKMSKEELAGNTPGDVRELQKSKSDAGGSQLGELRQKDVRYQAAAQYREAYLSYLSQQRLEERRVREGLANPPKKRQKFEKHITDNKSEQRQNEKDYIDSQSKQPQNENDNQGKQAQIEKDLIHKLIKHLRNKDSSYTEKMLERLLQNDNFAQLLEENRDKLFNKNNVEGTKKADPTTPGTPSSSPHIKNPNPSDPFSDGINNKQADSTTSKDHSFSPDFKTSNYEATNPQWRADQARSSEKSKFAHGFDQNDKKSTGSDATTPSDAQKSSDQQSAKADQKFSSTDDLYSKKEAFEAISAFFESKEGKIMFLFEQEFARTQKEFFEFGAARVDGEKVGVDNPQKIMKSMQSEIDECRLRLANVIDPKRVQLGEVQKEEYYSCLKDLASHLTTANTYMQNRIDATKSKTQSSPDISQWIDNKIPVAA